MKIPTTNSVTAMPDKHYYWSCYPVDDTNYRVRLSDIEAIVI